jgi:hypothetical protein
MQTLYRKFELARALNRDARFIARVGLVPAATSPDGSPLYDLESVKAQLAANEASRKVLRKS